MTLSLVFHGTRGSVPVSGVGTLRYGGNTPCLEIRSAEGGEGAGRVILDAGTGIRCVPPAPPGTTETLLLSHTHWDHIQGFPFFPSLHQEGVAIRILGPASPDHSVHSTLSGMMSPPVFPLPLTSVPADLSVEDLTTTPTLITTPDRFEILTHPLHHTGPTLGFRVRHADGPASVTYVTDNELGSDLSLSRRVALVQFVRGSSLLVHDAMYRDDEIGTRAGWGHSSIGEATRLALEAGCPKLVLFHHAPDRCDRAIDAMADEARAVAENLEGTIEIIAAHDTMHLTLQEGP